MKYRGFEIIRWAGPWNETPDKGEPKYFVQTYHAPTGVKMREDLCPRAWSIREAKEKIDQLNLK